jgi:undecaprenyl-diphosphatase
MFRTLLHVIDSWDVLLFFTISHRFEKNKFLHQLFYGMSISGDGLFFGSIAIFIIYISPDWGKDFINISVLALFIQFPIYYILKNTVKRQRPFAAFSFVSPIIIPPDKYSFPSGHTSTAFLLATILSFFLPILQWPLYIWSTLVGISRIYLGLHYPIDIIAGIILGIGSAYLSFNIILGI